MTLPPVFGDAVQVVADLEQPTPEPVLAGHLVTLVVDALVTAGLIPAWVALPDTVAALATLGGGLVMVLGHGAAWLITRGRVHAFRHSTPGRHAR